MTTYATSLPQLPQTVELRRVRSSEDVDLTGGDSGYEWDPRLRCRQVTMAAGPDGGHAVFDYVPLDGSPDQVEILVRDDVTSWYRIGDQIRVWVQPYSDPALAPDVADGRGVLVFDGVIERQHFEVRRQDGRDTEAIKLVAVPAWFVMSMHPTHLVRGRPVTDGDGGLLIAESPSLPVCFNFDGRRNRDGRLASRVTGTIDSAAIAASPFTWDGDAQGAHWTLREALKLLVVAWLIGKDGASLERNISLDAATRTMIAAAVGTSGGDRFDGVDQVLPEVDVTGLSVTDAIAKVCSAAGFDMAVTPAMSQEALDAADRPMQLSIWRRHVGTRTIDLLLPRRGEFNQADRAANLQIADLAHISGQRDGTAVANHHIAVGPLYAEVSVQLKPIWDPADEDAATIDATLQSAGSTTYHQRHVVGGTSFSDYGHVGRLWGLDCTGEYAASFYTSGFYQHAAGGTDWAALLEIDGEDAITAARTAAGISDPIVFLPRTRHALPLDRPATREAGIEYILEVSENAGSNWTPVQVECQTLRGFFGIRLTGLRNLAKVSLASLADETATVEPSASWWGLIRAGSQNLRLRLTCRIELDVATRYDAVREVGSAHPWTRARLLPVEYATTWVQPGSFFASEESDWTQLDSGAAASAVQQVAEQVRDYGAVTPLSASVANWLMTFHRWQVGDGVRGIRGRNLRFWADGAGQVRMPVINSVTLSLLGRQTVSFDLTDASARRGY